jgi:hypothetical protein
MSQRRFKVASLALLVFLSTAMTGYSNPAVRHSLASTLGGSYCGDVSARSANPTYADRVALIDELGQSSPNPALTAMIQSIANKTGHGFDYYPPAKATLNLMIDLPRMGYSMIILRSHGSGIYKGNASIITVSDAYSRYQRIGDQLQDNVVAVELDGSAYFGLTSGFVSHVMCGQFSNATILAMGCSTGKGDLGQAFVKRGARAFVGWNGSVTITFTDLVFESLAGLLLEGSSVDGAVQNATERFGPDPVYGALLSHYP